MGSLPSMLRVELWHPLIIHFPIVLLLVGTLLRLAGEIFPSVRFFVPTGRMLLGAGVLTAWAAIYTGTESYYAVVRTLCDPTVADVHASAAYRAAYLFSFAFVLDGVVWFRGLPDNWTSYFLTVLTALLLTGSGFLTYAGHQGARLVYQQGAAVHEPSPQCREFR